MSGMTNRFVGLWCYLQRHPHPDFELHWLTNETLWDKFFPGVAPPPSVTLMKADLKYFKFTSRLVYPFRTLYVYYRKQCTSVHVGTTVVNPVHLARLFNFFRLPYCFTYGNNSIDMGSYESVQQKKHWAKFFELAKNVDVLNPINSITRYRKNKFISPGSFPYLIETVAIPEQKFLNTKRENLLVFCGSFVERKDPLFALEGFYRYTKLHFKPDADNAKLVMIGKGSLQQQVTGRMQAINEEFGEKLVSLVPDSKLIDVLSQAKIFLSVQDFTNYPSQSLMEAMLFCNAVVSVDNGETKRLVVKDNGNVLLKEKDPEALGLAIHQLLQNWKLNFANRQHILNKFSPKVFADYLSEIHEKIVSEN